MVKLLGRNEGVVFGAYDQCWDRDAVDDSEAASSVVVVLGVAEAVVWCCEPLIKFSDRVHSRESGEIVATRPCARFSFHSLFQITNKVPLVYEIYASLKRLNAEAEVHRRGDGGYCL